MIELGDVVKVVIGNFEKIGAVTHVFKDDAWILFKDGDVGIHNIEYCKPTGTNVLEDLNGLVSKFK